MNGDLFRALRRTLIVALLAAPGSLATQAIGQAGDPARDPRTYHSVGTGLDRDLSPPQLVPDSTPPPKGAAEGHPAGIVFRDSPLGLIYTTQDGRTLYAMRVARLRYPGPPETYCAGPCTEIWKALGAPADVAPIGAWHVVNGVQGPQWAYGDTPVFQFSGDRMPGDLHGHEYEDMFFAINYIPPVPVAKLPGGVEPLFISHREYVLSFLGRALYAYPADPSCGDACQDLTPLAAPLAAKNTGDWAVAQSDEGATWTYSGKRVYVAPSADRGIVDYAAMVRPK